MIWIKKQTSSSSEEPSCKILDLNPWSRSTARPHDKNLLVPPQRWNFERFQEGHHKNWLLCNARSAQPSILFKRCRSFLRKMSSRSVTYQRNPLYLGCHPINVASQREGYCWKVGHFGKQLAIIVLGDGSEACLIFSQPHLTGKLTILVGVHQGNCYLNRSNWATMILFIRKGPQVQGILDLCLVGSECEQFKTCCYTFLLGHDRINLFVAWHAFCITG